MSESKNSPRRLLAAKKRSRALELRLQGLTYPEISEVMTKEFPGTSLGVQNCWKLVATEINYWNAKRAETVAQATRIELNRLDRLQRAIWTKAVEGDIKAVEAVAKLMDRRAKLLGLNAPEKVEVGGFLLGSLSDEELVEEAKRLGIKLEVEDAESGVGVPGGPQPDGQGSTE